MTKNRLLLLGLLVSISINLFFVGGIAYRVGNFNDERSGRPLPPNVGWIVRDLDEQRRSELEPQLRESFEQIRPIRREMIDAQRQVNALMSAQPFDAEALSEAFATLRAASIRYQELSHAQTSSIFGQLSEQERQAALEFVKRRGPRDGRDGFRGRTDGSGFRERRGSDGQRSSSPPPPPPPPPPAAIDQ
ncbi:MAG: periplasmic heavy metal sensor [Pseudohongiellaceae bacterium]